MTALRTIKERFGQSSVIVRALVNNMTKGEKIGRSDGRKLREFSIDLMTCLATLKRVARFPDSEQLNVYENFYLYYGSTITINITRINTRTL